MSCNIADITSDITDSCDSKCKLVTDYPSQGIECNGYKIIRRNPKRLQLSIVGIENLSSELNFTPYNCILIYLVKPSWHSYSGITVDAEMLIISKSNETGKYLYICIPIIEGNSSSDLDDIIHKADMSQESTFDLNNFIPQQPYYSYKGGLKTGDSCESTDYEIIVFQKRHALRLLKDNLNIIPTNTNTKFAINTLDSITFSKNKPLKNQNDASFPITCEPYDDSDMKPEIEKKKFRSPFTMSDKDFQEWSSNVAIQIIIGALVLYMLFKFLFLITSLVTKKASISSMDGGSLIMRY